MRNLASLLTVAFAAALLAHPVAAAKTYQEITVANGGTISGKVALGSAKPETQSFTISKNPEVCGTGVRALHWVRSNDGAVLDAVVYLEQVDAGKPFRQQAETVIIDQSECAFTPYLQTMANGGSVEVTNSDPVAHNIHTYEIIGRARRTVFNVGQPSKGDAFTKAVNLRRGVAMKVECDHHDFMHGWVFVASNPYYAVVNDKGEFTMTDVPPGKYVIKSWHGRLGEKEAAVEVKAGTAVEINFSY